MNKTGPNLACEGTDDECSENKMVCLQKLVGNISLVIELVSQSKSFTNR